MTFQYKQLPTIEGSDDIYIRLLRLPPGPRLGPIKCSIVTTRLSEAPDFEAVSYCWGPLSDHASIYITKADGHLDSINGHALEVPSAIIPFLYCTRGHHIPTTRILWIDSICINQQDPEERSRQVPKMSEIYHKAIGTISWLGPEQDGSNDAITYAIDLASMLRQHLAKSGKPTDPADKASEETNTEITVGDPRLEALFTVLDRPYFERAWVVQEVVVSNQVSLVCGDAVITWKQFLNAFTYLWVASPWIWEFYPSKKFSLLLTLKLTDDDWKTKEHLEWWKVLLRLRGFKATDPRDKIYAYYGLKCKDELRGLGIKPDYKNMTVHALYITLAANALMAGHSAVLHVPRLVRIGDEEDKSQQLVPTHLPSWVPDWQCTDQTPEPLVYGQDGTFGSKFIGDHRASGESKLNIAFDIPPEIVQDPDDYIPRTLPTMLRLRGFPVARTVHMTPTWNFRHLRGRQTLLTQARNIQNDREQIASWEAVVRPPAAPPHYHPTDQPQIEAVYDTIMGDAPSYPLETRQAAFAGFERRQRILRLIPTFHAHVTLAFYILIILADHVLKHFGYENPDTQFRIMMGNMIHRRAARCAVEGEVDKEYLALVPGLAAPGDYIMIVEGLRTPLVLRRRGRGRVGGDVGRGKEVDVWEIIGDCYVHGIMDGGLWEKRQGECEDVWIV